MAASSPKYVKLFAKPAASTHTTCVEHGRAIIALHDELAEQTASAIITLQDELAEQKEELKNVPILKAELVSVKMELKNVLRVADALTQLVATMVNGRTNSGPASPASTGSTTFLLPCLEPVQFHLPRVDERCSPGEASGKILDLEDEKPKPADKDAGAKLDKLEKAEGDEEKPELADKDAGAKLNELEKGEEDGAAAQIADPLGFYEAQDGKEVKMRDAAPFGKSPLAKDAVRERRAASQVYQDKLLAAIDKRAPGNIYGAAVKEEEPEFLTSMVAHRVPIATKPAVHSKPVAIPMVDWERVSHPRRLPRPRHCPILGCSGDAKFYTEPSEHQSDKWRTGYAFGYLPGFETDLGIVAPPTDPVHGFVYAGLSGAKTKWVLRAEPVYLKAVRPNGVYDFVKRERSVY
jgi:hypothetical protein